MTNLEKYMKEIALIAVSDKGLAVLKNNTPAACEDIACSSCIAYKNGGCTDIIKEWANKEYIEAKTFTDDEKDVVRHCQNLNFIARDKDGELFAYNIKPKKGESMWSSVNFEYASMKVISDEPFNNIRWEDEEPTSREEILGE